MSICVSVCMCPALEEGEYPFCSMYTYVENCKIRININNFLTLCIPMYVPGGKKIKILLNFNRTTRKITRTM